jgi:hypothetical protein
VVLLCALAVCGCGRTGDRTDVEHVTTRFLGAVQRQDGRLACAQLSQDAIKQLEQQQQGACPGSVTKLQLAPARLRDVEVFAFNAKVDLANGASAFLERTATGWRIAAVGCRATEGDPTSHPMSCELQS